jgi:micrococcal nuclease
MGLLGFLILSSSLARALWRTAAPTSAYPALATSALETALASQLGTLRAGVPTAPAMPSPKATSTMPPPSSSVPANPWAAAIPEAACIPADLPQTGKVIGVVDGAIIRVLLDADGRVYSVRYIGVVPPDTSQGPLLTDATTIRNMKLTYLKQATLVRDITDADQNGLLLRYVMVEGTFVNYALVADGYAKTAASPPDTACQFTFDSAQAKARTGGLGVWASVPDSISPPTSP